jgi:simple sugar transport system permease protein
VLRAVGDNHDRRTCARLSGIICSIDCVLFGGMMAGLGGAYLPLVLTPHWAEGMTAGRGWIAAGSGRVCILVAVARPL